jgi:hypothetical protein
MPEEFERRHQMSFERRDHRPLFAWRLGVREIPDADGIMLLPMTVPLRTLVGRSREDRAARTAERKRDVSGAMI